MVFLCRAVLEVCDVGEAAERCCLPAAYNTIRSKLRSCAAFAMRSLINALFLLCPAKSDPSTNSSLFLPYCPTIVATDERPVPARPFQCGCIPEGGTQSCENVASLIDVPSDVQGPEITPLSPPAAPAGKNAWVSTEPSLCNIDILCVRIATEDCLCRSPERSSSRRPPPHPPIVLRSASEHHTSGRRCFPSLCKGRR